MKLLLSLLVAAALVLPAVRASAQRQNIPLPDGWKFLKHDTTPDAAVSDEWQTVSVPHCWNALDGQNGRAADPGVKDGYYRGPAWYVRPLDIPADWKDRRVFIRFGAAFLVADVYLNGEHLGQHRGGFAAFCYELTPNLKFGAPNELRVRVDNAKNNDIAPLSADFTMEGGIYRPVELLVIGKGGLYFQPCITPLDFAGPGVYATPENISSNGADLEVETKLLNYPAFSSGIRLIPQVQTQILDAEGKVMSSEDTAVPNKSIKQRFHLNQPHLWNGLNAPYVYTVHVKLLDGENVIDEVTQPLGFRMVAVSQEKGFLLNGQPYPIHGVNRHQEKRDQGWALSNADHDADFQTMREMGVTAVRLAHYQQAEHVHDLGDKNGMLLWQEIPVVNEIDPGDAFADNAKQQLTEMIRQGYNHPSIMTWSTFNELYNGKTPPPEPLIAALDKLARELDPTRIPAGVSAHPEKAALNRIPEWIGYNDYPGWYGRDVEKLDADVRHFSEIVGGKRIAVTEYGAGANPAQHPEGVLIKPKSNNSSFHPEEWQTFVHERHWAQLRTHPSVWGTFIWCMFDFASDSRNEGDKPGVNDKGMVTEDRKTRKDAFYFYKSNWNPEPMVYLTSRRMTPRIQAQTEIKAYSNAGEVGLTINGQKIGAAKPDDVQICRWPGVTLKPGVNRVEVVAHTGGKELRDQCDWTLEPPAPVIP